MGKYKNSLPEDIDITDPRDSGDYTEMDAAMDLLTSSVATIKKQPLDKKITYLDELGEARDSLNEVIDSVVL